MLIDQGQKVNGWNEENEQMSKLLKYKIDSNKSRFSASFSAFV